MRSTARSLHRWPAIQLRQAPGKARHHHSSVGVGLCRLFLLHSPPHAVFTCQIPSSKNFQSASCYRVCVVALLQSAKSRRERKMNGILFLLPRKGKFMRLRLPRAGRASEPVRIGHKRRRPPVPSARRYGLCFMNVAIRPGYQSGILAAGCDWPRPEHLRNRLTSLARQGEKSALRKSISRQAFEKGSRDPQTGPAIANTVRQWLQEIIGVIGLKRHSRNMKWPRRLLPRFPILRTLQRISSVFARSWAVGTHFWPQKFKPGTFVGKDCETAVCAAHIGHREQFFCMILPLCPGCRKWQEYFILNGQQNVYWRHAAFDTARVMNR